MQVSVSTPDKGTTPVRISGIHHITGIVSDAQATVDFFTNILGLRMVKLTVNYDDPSSHHLYFANQLGQPGSILTYFAWPGAMEGRVGSGQVTATAFAIPANSIGWWRDRLARRGIMHGDGEARFDEEVLAFEGPDGQPMELVARADWPALEPWPATDIPDEHAIRGFAGATLSVAGYERTARLFSEVFGFEKRAEADNRFRFEAPATSPGRFVDLLCTPDGRPGRFGPGTIHHIALRAADLKEQSAWREKLVDLGYNVTPSLDRNYFRSIYFREPGGVIIEIATDPPGFTVDESIETMGTRLVLPSWLESRRAQVTDALPSIILPGGMRAS